MRHGLILVGLVRRRGTSLRFPRVKQPDDTMLTKTADELTRCPRFGLRGGMVATSLIVLAACGPSAAEEQARHRAVEEAEAQREERLRLAAAVEAERFRTAELAAATEADAEARARALEQEAAEVSAQHAAALEAARNLQPMIEESPQPLPDL